MSNVLRLYPRWRWTCAMALSLCFAACADDEQSSDTYDPNAPVTLTDYYPTTGPISTQIILNGSNFGTDKNNVRVFFNEKEAAVISVTNQKMLVLAPKLPGEACVIKVQVGDKTNQYAQVFDYIVQTNVSTLVGGDKNATQSSTGTVTLAEAQFKKSIGEGIAVDAGKNIYFVMDESDGRGYVYVLNEEANQLKVIKSDANYFLSAPVLSYNMIDDHVYLFAANSGSHGFSYFEANNGFAEVNMGDVVFDDPNINPGGWSSWGARKSFAMNPANGYFYCRSIGGYFYRINPENKTGENLTRDRQVGTADGVSFGSAFDPNNSNILYFSNEGKHCIYKYNISTDEWDVFAGTGTAGYLDGYITEAQFNNPCQIAFDPDGDMYISDRNNHCIRKIAMKTGYVSTVAGLPQQSGYRNGTNAVAQFDQPVGLAIDTEGVIYVGDSENRAIRRIAVE